MAEIQADRLREMMHIAPPSTRLRVSTLAFDSKKSALEKLLIGDIVLLPIGKVELVIVDDLEKIVGIGEYGYHGNRASILIASTHIEPINKLDSKKYKKLQVILGEIEYRDLQKDKIVPLYRDTTYDATLYRDNQIVAYANLALVDQKIALTIERVI